MQVLTMKSAGGAAVSAGPRLVPCKAARAEGLGERLIRQTACALRTYWHARSGDTDRRELRVLETLQLGARRQLLLVSCKGERFLVGTGAADVQTIVRLRREGMPTDVGEAL